MATPAPTPVSLVENAMTGDPDAFRALMDAYGSTVWGLCRRLSPEPEDAYQEVWEKVFRHLPRFDAQRGPFAPWLTAVTHRHLIDRHRRRKVRGEVVELPDLADPGPSAEDRLLRTRRNEALERAIRRLPEPQRRIVVLFHLYGRPLDAIAETEGLALGTVKSRLHRGRARLAELLGDPA